MRQSGLMKKYDPETGRYVKTHIYGEGISDVFGCNSIGTKLFGKTMKTAAKTAAKKAATTAATKTGHAGNKQR